MTKMPTKDTRDCGNATHRVNIILSYCLVYSMLIIIIKFQLKFNQELEKHLMLLNYIDFDKVDKD